MKESMQELKDSHITEEQIRQYIQGSLADGERERAEGHMADCDVCLGLFMDALESETAFLPDADIDIARLEQKVIARLELEQPHKQQTSPAHAAVHKKEHRRSWMQHPVTHYTVAASITLLLFASGSFGMITNTLAKLDQNGRQQQEIALPEQPERLSWSEQMVGRTGSWLDGLQAKRFK